MCVSFRKVSSHILISNTTGYVPQMDPETNLPLQSDTQAALSLTAFIVAGGAVALRIGGRAALVSALGLDFTQNPELKDSLDQVMDFTSNMDMGLELGLFVLAWTFVKVFCFDAGGVVLALASGVLFGGVWEGAIFSAFAATVGSSVAFGMAKVDSPIRKKALEVVEEYPSLRGIEKVRVVMECAKNRLENFFSPWFLNDRDLRLKRRLWPKMVSKLF